MIAVFFVCLFLYTVVIAWPVSEAVCDVLKVMREIVKGKVEK